MVTHRWPSPQRPARVVVLGSSGVVGRSVCAHLADCGMAYVPLSSAEVDLCSPESVPALAQRLRPDDALVIISALTPDQGKGVGTFMKNVTMGANLVACLEQTPCAHVVYLSSDAVYAEDTTLVREESATEPSSFHGLMHLVRERLLAEALRPSGAPYLVLRPCALYGPEDTHQSYGPNRFLRRAVTEGVITLFGEGEERRDHVYLEDLSRLIGLCLAHRTDGVLNVAVGESISFGAIARMVAELCNVPVRMESRPRQGPVTHRHMEITALIRAFPSFRFAPMQEGLGRTLQALSTVETRHVRGS